MKHQIKTKCCGFETIDDTYQRANKTNVTFLGRKDVILKNPQDFLSYESCIKNETVMGN